MTLFSEKVVNTPPDADFSHRYLSSGRRRFAGCPGVAGATKRLVARYKH
jgi:hypothetical protein